MMLERTFSICRRLVGLAAKEPLPGGVLTEDDRRIWVRYPANRETTYQPAGEGEEKRFAARIRDVSRGGINLLVGREFQPGDLLSVELPARAEGRTFSVLACIVRVERQADGDWSLGCIFSRELGDDDLQTLGAQRMKHPPSDQRTWVRFPVKVRASYQVISANDPTDYPAEVLDISASGVGLLVRQAVDTGALLSVTLQGSEGKPGRTILACVVHTSGKEENRWGLGCNFIRELTDEDLEALV
jgi:c-di-GMP-binding flagellar brake protein YcgR